MEREKEEEIFEKINIVEASVEKQNIQQKIHMIKYHYKHNYYN